jgi:hypothetical protein
MLATLLEAGAPSPGVDLSLRLGPFRAQLSVCEHAVSDVVCGPFVGEDALFRLLLLPRRPVAQRKRLSRPDGPVLGDVGSLLMRFVVFESELERGARHVGGLDRVWRIRFAALKTILENLPEDVKRVIRLCDGTRDVRHLCAEGPLSPLVTLRVLDKLLVAGVLVRADILDDDDAGTDGIAADRRWQQARETTPPTAATTTSPGMPEAPAAAEAAASSSASSAPAEPLMLSTTKTTASTTTATATATTATTTALDVVAQARQRATPASMISGETALPRPTPRPSEDLQAWLGEEAAFFADAAPHGPKHTPWPLWQLGLLLVGGGVVGGLMAHACG